MTTTTKRSFHLPWGNDDHDPDADGSATAAAAAADPGGGNPKASSSEPTAPSAGGGVRAALRKGPMDELGRGPFDLAPSASGDPGATPADDLVDNEEILKRMPDRSMPDQVAPVPEEASAEAQADPNFAWPDVDRAGSSTHLASDTALPPVRPPVVVKGDPGKSGRRDNALVVGLVKAMRDAARATRLETTGRMRVAATARIDEIRAAGAIEAGSLKKRADEDVVAIREWSKAEMARIRDEAEQRITGRKAQLAREATTYTAEIERVIDEVKAAATAFEAEMEAFFEVLLAEEDPARLATLAERVPEAPVFAKPLPVSRSPVAGRGAGNGRAKPTRQRAATNRRPSAATQTAPTDGPSPDAGDTAEARLEPDAAAAAEAEAIAGLDMAGLEVDPVAEASPESAPESTADVSPEPSPEPDDAPANEWGSGSLAGFLSTAPRIDSPDDLSPEERVALLGPDPSEDADENVTEPSEATEPDAESEATAIAEPAPAPATAAEPAAEPATEFNSEPIGETASEGPPADPAMAAAPPVEQLTKLVVSGLTSVAGISGFKAALNRVPGVTSVSVTSGHDDDFIFAVNHQGGTDLRRAVGEFQGFSAQMTFDDGSIINWTVAEPAA